MFLISTGADAGREQLKIAAQKIDDTDVLHRIECFPQFLYHQAANSSKSKNTGKNCYSYYKHRADREYQKAVKREREQETELLNNDNNPNPTEENVEARRRVRSRTESGIGDKPAVKCIICDKEREAGGARSRELFRLCEPKSTQDFIDAFTFFDDDVAKRCVLMNTVEALWPNDVMYHRNCLRPYISTYKYKVSLVLIAIEKADDRLKVDSRIAAIFDQLSDELCSGFGISLTDITGIINKGLDEDKRMINRSVKMLLTKHFGEGICFTIPAEKNKSTIVYSSHLITGNIVEATRQNVGHPFRDVAKVLRAECKNYDFGLQSTYCTSDDLKLSMSDYQHNRPKKWLEFIRDLFPATSSKNSKEWLLKFDVIFQYFHYWMTQGKFTPMHCSMAQTFDDLTKCRKIIDIGNRLNFCISYDAMKRLTTAYGEKLVDDAKPFKCPLPSLIDDNSPIQGAFDNFDHNESTAAGMDSSHDTVLVIFQNKETTQALPVTKKTHLTHSLVNRKFVQGLPCQILHRSGLKKNSACVPDGFSPSENLSDDKEAAENVANDFMLWSQCRNYTREDNSANVPTFTALESYLLPMPKKFHATTTAFIPILPYKATEMDSIFTTMLNFQDVLLQRGERVGALWCDEGVYALAKEIQILKPDIFSNIFLGLGPFHMEKIVMACLGKFLECIGIDAALVESGVYGIDVVPSKVMSGKHYVMSKEGMMIIADAMYTLLFQAFKDAADSEILRQVLEYYKSEINNIIRMLDFDNEDDFRLAWEQAKVAQQQVHEIFMEWKNENMSNENVLYWSLFLDEIYPILRDLTFSIRIADWLLYVDVVNRAIPLFFGFGRVNYGRYTPLFLNDCLELKLKMPELYNHFVKGGWVMYYGLRKGSSIGFDMGLEKAYNKTAKSAAGIIGMTARKEAVALWNVVKHEKSLHTANVSCWSGFYEDKDSELDLHHEFKPSSARKSNERVQQLIDYIDMIGSPFSADIRLRDVCKGVTIAQNVVHGILSCLDVGKRSYKDFVQTRFVEKSVLLHDPIQSNKNEVMPKPLNHIPEPDDTMQTKVVGKVKDMKEAQTYLDSAVDRGYDMKRLLSYEITSTAYFLVTEKEGALHLKKNAKSTLSRELISLVPKEERDIQLTDQDIDVTIVDFMAVVRMLPVKKFKLKTYDNFAAALKDFIMDYARGTSRIDIIFDVYNSYSIKYTERNSRAQSGSGGITVKIKKDEQKLPVDMNSFWESIENKSQLQSFFMSWMGRKYRGNKEIYFGGVDEKYCFVLKAGVTTPCEDLLSMQEEADERMAFHIHHAHLHDFKKVFVLSNVLLLLLYHKRIV